jgi:hypothetical protein
MPHQILLIVFVVCMLLWLISVTPATPDKWRPYSGFIAWLAVLALAFLIGVL